MYTFIHLFVVFLCRGGGGGACFLRFGGGKGGRGVTCVCQVFGVCPFDAPWDPCGVGCEEQSPALLVCCSLQLRSASLRATLMGLLAAEAGLHKNQLAKPLSQGPPLKSMELLRKQAGHAAAEMAVELLEQNKQVSGSSILRQARVCDIYTHCAIWQSRTYVFLALAGGGGIELDTLWWASFYMGGESQLNS